MPIYFMSLFYLPRKVRLRLKKIQRDFLWGGGALVQKSHFVRWNLVCLEKRKGGLGVRNLALLNIALLSGISVLPMKERLFRSKSSVTSMVKRRGVGHSGGKWEIWCWALESN